MVAIEKILCLPLQCIVSMKNYINWEFLLRKNCDVVWGPGIMGTAMHDWHNRATPSFPLDKSRFHCNRTQLSDLLSNPFSFLIPKNVFLCGRDRAC